MLTTEAKISSDMPLPMPRWVMSSPSHMSRAVPAVSVSTTSSTRPALKSGEQVECRWSCRRAEQPAAAVVEQEGEAGRLHERDGDGEVAGPLGDLALPDRALLLPLLELGDHHREDLHDDRRRDVRHDPEGEDRELGERAAGEQLEEPEHAAAVSAWPFSSSTRVEVDARHRDVGARTGTGR